MLVATAGGRREFYPCAAREPGDQSKVLVPDLVLA